MQQRVAVWICLLSLTTALPPRNWVDTIILSCCSSQSAELSAESGHMSYLGSMFSFFFFSYPPRVKIQEAGP